MLTAVLLLQATSLLARPLYLTEEPPELRSVQHVLLLHRDVPDVPPGVVVTRERALAFGRELVADIRGGLDFAEAARQHSQALDAHTGAVLGTFAEGMLHADLDAFLFGAEVGEVSDPIVTRTGVHILKRVESHAAVRHLFIAGLEPEARERMETVREALAGGADFAELAKQHSDEASTAADGGRYQIFERGARDRLIKKAAFESAIGEWVGPIQSAQGFHFVKRVAEEELGPEFLESKWVRARAILVSYADAVGAAADLERTQQEAKRIALELHARIAGGEDMATVAREFNEDPGGRERAGDLGWIHRQTPDLPRVMTQVFLARRAGWTSEPIATSAGYVILRRER